MKISITARVLLISLTLPVFVSCGGGSVGTDPLAGGGIGGTGVSVGKITGFGSVIVNGVEFETQGATIIKDGINVAVVNSLEDREHLRVGMIVTVHATFNRDGTTGTASSIEFKDNLEGPVAGVNTQSQTFVVLGQTVIVDGATILEDKVNNTVVEKDVTKILDTLALAIDNIVEVSGFVEADGSIRATYIELKDKVFTPNTPEEEIELKGSISNLNNDIKTFTLGALTVNFSNVKPENMPGGLSDGLFVEVKSTAGFNDAGALIASKIEAEDAAPDRKEGDKAEIEGYAKNVSTIDSEVSFELNGQPVLSTSTTEYKNGIKANVIEDVKLEVEGTVDANGILIAQKISIEGKDDSGEESSKDVSLDTGGLPGTEGTSLNTSVDPKGNSNEEPTSEGDGSLP